MRKKRDQTIEMTFTDVFPTTQICQSFHRQPLKARIVSDNLIQSAPFQKRIIGNIGKLGKRLSFYI